MALVAALLVVAWGSTGSAAAAAHEVTAGADSHSVARLYRAYFQRDADPGGLAHWTAEHVGGRSLNEISQGFARSKEFDGLYGGLSDTAFVDLVYRNVLGRSADRAGREHWTAVLASGVSRGSVMLAFSDSAEFKFHTGLYNAGLRVLLIGDSLMYEAGPYGVERLRQLGFDVHLEAYPGSGLLASAVPMDWLSLMNDLVDRIDPDLVVVEFCCNHWASQQPEGHPFRHIRSDTQEFRQAWGAAADEATRILTSRGASMAWVVTPPVRDPYLQSMVTDLNNISRALSDRFGFDLIAWDRALAPSGSYQDHVAGELFRHPDGLHFAAAGARQAGLTTATWVTLAGVSGR